MTMDTISPKQLQMFADKLTSKICFKDNERSSPSGMLTAYSLIYPGDTEKGRREICVVFYFLADKMKLI